MDNKPLEVQNAENKMRNEWAKLKAIEHLFSTNAVLPALYVKMFPDIVNEDNMITWDAVKRQEKIYFDAMDECMKIMEKYNYY